MGSPYRNIYQLYEQNGYKCGFTIERNSWGGTVATVKSIGGKTRDKLPGRPPYYGNPEVIADVEGTWTEQDAVLPCPGTYAWRFFRFSPTKASE